MWEQKWGGGVSNISQVSSAKVLGIGRNMILRYSKVSDSFQIGGKSESRYFSPHGKFIC